jgi:hypothetical protein
MESKSRNIWIIVIAAAIILCCCLVTIGGLAIGLTSNWLRDYWRGDLGWSGWQPGLVSETVEQRFEVGAAPTVSVDSFAGDVAVQAITVDTIEIIATKRVPRNAGFDRIEVNFEQTADGLRIEAVRPGITGGNMSVRLDILVPPGTALDISLGAGTVSVEGLAGGIQIDSGAGNVDIRSAEGQVRVGLGAGNINYEGLPSGDSRLTSGAGNIDIDLPPDANLRIDLDTSIGNLTLRGVDVEGQVTRRTARGIIGSGGEASITAQTGAGNITLR